MQEMMKDGSFSNTIQFGNIVPIPPKIIVLIDIDGKNLANLPIDLSKNMSLSEIKDLLKGKISYIK